MWLFFGGVGGERSHLALFWGEKASFQSGGSYEMQEMKLNYEILSQ